MVGSVHAQVMQRKGTFPHNHRHTHAAAPSDFTPPAPPAAKTPFSEAAPAPAPAPAPASTAAPVSSAGSGNLPPSLLDQPAQPAKIKLSNGELSIEAQNSSLSELLHQISAATGMKVEGLAADQRIFGSYGPGTPRQVLLSLLVGSGYNVVMLGGAANQVPLRLELSSPNQASAAPAANTPTQAGQASEATAAAPRPPTRTFTPPRQQQEPSAQNEDQQLQQHGNEPPQNGVRTPQQLLQQLQQLHDREQQQQEQQEPQ